jgi:adenylate kinase
MEPITTIFFGPSGAGKGTQVQMLFDIVRKRSDRKIIYIEMGKLLRDLVTTGNKSGNLTNEIISRGARMPDFMPVYLMTRKLVDEFTGEEHIVGDGVARGADQTRGWDDAMQFYGRANYHVINMKLSEESIMTRLLARGRNDDTKEGIKNRISWYTSEVAPQIEIFKSRGRHVHDIDGESDAETVHRAILTALEFPEETQH